MGEESDKSCFEVEEDGSPDCWESVVGGYSETRPIRHHYLFCVGQADQELEGSHYVGRESIIQEREARARSGEATEFHSEATTERIAIGRI